MANRGQHGAGGQDFKRLQRLLPYLYRDRRRLITALVLLLPVAVAI
jgi:hypothetical protein